MYWLYVLSTRYRAMTSNGTPIMKGALMKGAAFRCFRLRPAF